MALEEECDKLRKQVEELQSRQEEFSLREQVYKEQLIKTRTQHQVEITETSGRLTQEYEAKLQQSLQEQRDRHAREMRSNKNQIVRLFQTQINNLKSQARRNSASASIAADERDIKIGELESANAAHEIHVRVLERMLDDERQRHAEGRAALEAELQKSRNENANFLQEFEDYQEEMGVEIEKYLNLIKRLTAILNPPPSQSSDIPIMPGTPVEETPVCGGER